MARGQGDFVVLLLSTVESDPVGGMLARSSHGDPLPHEAPGLLAKNISSMSLSKTRVPGDGCESIRVRKIP